ncbi:hypothetical protein [Beijerinckia indica]|uniref:Uncharacterized protein n=1 Tax=Beijerinckia indica subsp. indica (strain ATCC 9039 / DSM 1715 / NCIMB 8712) TaxID=395963 RepID=B2IFX6_BEII9|nr:hypothetical protein [Beijerinckia indica]ACB95715.1 conserved hypothetical protein [Beijerinckia indica subsp. indica ATCC 9039]
MMNTLSLATAPRGTRLAWGVLLAAASLIFSGALACAVPLAAFAAISALTLNRREALIASFSVFLVNQAVGFTFLHYPTDVTTLAWGAALGAITLLSCAAASTVTHRVSTFAGALAAFLASFLIYEGTILALALATDSGAGALAAAVIGRIFLINAVTFAGLLAVRVLVSTLIEARLFAVQ